MNPLKELHSQGQSVWLDFISRHLIDSGTQEARPLSGMFTLRQAEVVQALRKGKANKIIAYELNLLIGENADFFAVDRDDPDCFALLKHRDSEQRPNSGHVSDTHRQRIALQVCLFLPHVSDMDRLPGPDGTHHRN